MKEKINLFVISVILILSVLNVVTDNDEMHEHRDFFNKMTKFADTGARFTAEDGKHLCTEINKIKVHNEVNDLLDCTMYTKGE